MTPPDTTADTVAALLPPSVVLAAAGLLGLLVGSFLNVVIHRVPAGLSLVSPGSACPACGSKVRGYDNVPVLSWLLLRGRCRRCAAPIAWRYPAVEVATALLFAATAWRFGATALTVGLLGLVAAGVALFAIDLDHRRLPFAITGVAGLVLAAALLVEVATGGAEVLPRALSSLALWLVVYGAIWLLTSGRGMGLGDVALAPVLGLALGWVGWGASLVGLLGGFLVGAVVGLALIASGRAGARSKVPHGPFMLTGTLLGLFAGEPVFGAYLRLFGL